MPLPGKIIQVSEDSGITKINQHPELYISGCGVINVIN